MALTAEEPSPHTYFYTGVGIKTVECSVAIWRCCCWHRAEAQLELAEPLGAVAQNDLIADMPCEGGRGEERILVVASEYCR